VVEPWNRENHRKQGGLCFVLYGIPTLVKNGPFFTSSLSIHLLMDIYTVEYYSAMKKNELMPFAATLMDVEIIIPNKVGQIKANI